MSVKFKKWLKRGICFIAGCGIGFCIGYGIVSSIPRETPAQFTEVSLPFSTDYGHKITFVVEDEKGNSYFGICDFEWYQNIYGVQPTLVKQFNKYNIIRESKPDEKIPVYQFAD